MGWFIAGAVAGLVIGIGLCVAVFWWASKDEIEGEDKPVRPWLAK